MDRISFLVAEGHRDELWRAVGLVDLVSLPDDAFVEMFPEARFKSWRVMAAMQGGKIRRDLSSSNSSSSSSSRPPHHSSQAASSQAVSGTTGNSSSSSSSSSSNSNGNSSSSTVGSNAAASGGGSRPARKRALPVSSDLAITRMQQLQDYATRNPAWEAEILTWSEEQWVSAAVGFTPSKVELLDLLLLCMDDSAGQDVSESSQRELHTSPRPEEVHKGRRIGSRTTLYAAVTNIPSEALKQYTQYDTWKGLDKAVQGVPQWRQQWEQLRGQPLRDLLHEVQQVQPADPAAVRSWTYKQHLHKLLGLDPPHGSKGGSSGSGKGGSSSSSGKDGSSSSGKGGSSDVHCSDDAGAPAAIAE